MKSYKHFTLFERECLQKLLSEGKSFREIAKKLGRSPSTISREVKRNFSVTKKRYHPWRATVLYIIRRRKCVRKYKIQPETELYNYIISKLNVFWSPEIISYRAKAKGFDVSTATIYRAIYDKRIIGITARTHLRRRDKFRYKSKTPKKSVYPTFTIHERPEIVETKTRLGDFEGDTVLGAVGKGCIVTMVDRVSKLLVASLSRTKEKEEIRSSIQKAFSFMQYDIPIETITLDNGSEFADYQNIEKDLKTTIYFADPHSPWQRGLNENTNDLLRFFYPKGCDFLKVTEDELQKVVSLINNRPRKCLGYLSPLEFLSKKCCT